MSTRSRARQVVVQMLFQSDLNPDGSDQQQTFLRSRLNKNMGLVEFANHLIFGVRHHQEQLDSALQSAANNWSVPRMAVTDRSILRLATFELLHTDTPAVVVINEAIELAKRFGSNQSAGFVNGILDRVNKSNSPDTQTESTDSVASPPPTDTDADHDPPVATTDTQP